MNSTNTNTEPINNEESTETIEKTETMQKTETIKQTEVIETIAKSEDKKSIAWIAAPIVVCIVAIGLGIFLYFDYKKKIFFFKNKIN